MNRFFSIVLALAAALVAGGCMHPSPVDSSRLGPFFTPHNYFGEKKMPVTIHRVVLMPLHGGDYAPEEATEALDQIFATALERQMRFEVVTLPRDECQKCFGVPDIASVSALPHDFLADLGRKYGADAVLLVDITSYKGFRPLILGIRAKLARVSDRSLIWTFDEVYSATDPGVANSVRRYFIASNIPGVPVDMTPSTLESPSDFAAYAADATFKTLPPR
jgi:hypothetical protein